MSPSAITLQRIVVATDFSPHAERAVERALQLAAFHGAELNIVHIIEEGIPPEAIEDAKTKSLSRTQEILAANPNSGAPTITIDNVVGRPELDIVERSTMFNADCVILGLHDRLLEENRPIEDTLAETVIRESNLPVLLVMNRPVAPYKSVIVAVDFSSLAHDTIRSAVLIAPDARLHLIHAYEAGDKAEEKSTAEELARLVTTEKYILGGAAGAAGLGELSIDAEAEFGDPRAVIKDEVKIHNADLVVLGTHGTSGLARTLMGSVTTDIINERLGDVLVICPET